MRSKAVPGKTRPGPGDLARDASARRPAPRARARAGRLPVFGEIDDWDWDDFEQAMADDVDPRDDPASPGFERHLDVLDVEPRIDSHWDEEHEDREVKQPNG